MNSLLQWEQTIHLRPETTWGEASPSALTIPLPCWSYDVSMQRFAPASNSFCGARQLLSEGPARQWLAGRVTAPLFAFHAAGRSAAEHLLDWVIDPGPNPDSFTVELMEGDVGSRQHTGLCIDQLLIEGNVKNEFVSVELALMGREDGELFPAPTPATPPAAAAVRFRDVRLEIESSSSSGTLGVPLRSVRLQIRNGLRRYHTASVAPTLITAGPRQVRLDVTTPRLSDQFDDMTRSLPAPDLSCRLTLIGPHLGTAPTGTQTRIDLAFRRARWTRWAPRPGPDGVVDDAISFIALKPASQEEIEMTASLIG